MVRGIYDVLPEYEPIAVNFLKDSSAKILKRNHGIRGSIKLHNISSQINNGRPELEKIIIEYLQ